MKSKPVKGGPRDRESKNKIAKVKRYSQIKPAQKSKAKTRKEIRKQERKNKKAKKHAFTMSKSRKAVEEDNKEPKSPTNSKHAKGKNPKANNNQTEVHQIAKKDTTSQRRKKENKEFRHDEAKLKKEMEETRKKRLLEDNVEEDRTISQLEKKLRINKKAIIPASFRTDGLDYLLEICSSSKRKKDKTDKNAEKGKYIDSASEDEEMYSDDDDFNEDSDDEGGIHHAKQKPASEITRSKNKNSSQSESDEDDYDDLGSVSEDEEGSFGGSEDLDLGNSEDDDDNELDLDDSDNGAEAKLDRIDTEKPKEDYWEDIYGRLRNKDGSVIDEKTLQPKSEAPALPGGKYIPPGKRGNQSAKDKIIKSLKGLLNRLAESNMHNISQQIEQLYMSNSRNEMNESMLELFYLSLASDVAMPERIILEHIMLITILHANVGSEIGAYFIQNFVQKFKKTYDETESLQDSKTLHNLCLLISSTYHFKIVGCGLLFDILNFMAANFKPKDIELILTILKSIGFRLRKDDPLLLKNLILLLQEKAASNSEHSDSRVKFMLEIILAIKNNNMTKIPNYDPSYGEHLLKMLKQHFHKGNYVTELKIAMQDLLNADIKGKWWVVGSAWSNDDKLSSSLPNSNESKIGSVPSQSISKKLLAKAKKFGMNTDTRRNIFCIIMTAEDYLDAFEKLIHLGLKNQLEREIIHVIVYCTLHEKKYNPFYALILSKLCSTERRFMYSATLKLEVVAYAKILGQRTASRLFHISQKRIHEWIKENNSNITDGERPEETGETNADVPSPSDVAFQNQTIYTSIKRKAASSVLKKEEASVSNECIKDKKRPKLSSKSVKQVLDLNVETELCEWVQFSDTRPSSTEVRHRAIELYRLKGYDTIKCSYGWYRRWAERFKTWAATYDDTDPVVLSWLLEQYDENNVVSYSSLQFYAQEILKSFKLNFKASQGWATRFVKRHHVLLNWNGFTEEKLPSNLQSRITDFLSVVKQMNLSELQENQIGCMDEIPLSFAGSSKEKDSMDSDVKISRLRKICVKNCDATAIISLLADGSMLPPMVVVKGQKVSSLNQVYSINDNPVIVFYSKSTEPTISALEKWLELVWLKNTKQPSVLFCDSYGLHRQFSSACQDAGIKQEIFPSGCSCKLQPINVYAKLTFQKLIDNLWEEYLRKHSCDPKIKLPSTNEMVEWVSLAYETMKNDVHKEKLTKSFKKAGLLAQGHTG